VTTRDEDLTALMRAANSGDAAAYKSLLQDLSRSLRPLVRAACARVGLPSADVEDMVQDVLLAVHLKRHTWDSELSVGPWLRAIVRHKVIDGFRRRGRRDEVPIEDFLETLPAEEEAINPSREALERYTDSLVGKQREVVRAIGMNGFSITQTSAKLGMSEGAVRVSLHRGLATLARLYRSAEA
jgi:RNA polymerase sigma-70 factor (ECF subfamily)